MGTLFTSAPSVPTSPAAPPGLAGGRGGRLSLDFLRKEITTPSFFSETVNKAVWPDRAYLLARIRRAQVYYKGQQYIAPFRTASGLVDYRSVSGSSTLQLSSAAKDSSLLDYVMNIYRGDMRKFVAVLGQRSPNVKALPLVKGSPTHEENARLADLVASYLHDLWKVDEKHRDLVFKLAKSGPVFSYTPFNTSGGTYGTSRIPQYGSVTVDGGRIAECPHCQDMLFEDELREGGTGLECPTCNGRMGEGDIYSQEPFEDMGVVGEDVFDNGAPELHLCTGLTVTTPFDVSKTDLTDCPWLRYEYYADKGSLIAAHPQVASDPALIRKIEGHIVGYGTIGREYQERTQEQMESQSGTTTQNNRSSRWLYTCHWMRPSNYYTIAMHLGTDTERAIKVVNALREEFPSGVKLTFLNGYLIDSKPEDMSDVWAVCKSDSAETIWTDPIFEDYIQAQDQVNDILNLIIERLLRGLPVTLFDPEVLDPDFIHLRGRNVNELIPAKPGTGQTFDRAFYKLDIAKFEPELIAVMEKVIGYYREIIGILPALFGGGGPEPTARAAEIKRNQALQQLNTIWNECRTFWERTYRNGSLQMARYSPFRGYFPATDYGDQNYLEFGDLTPLLGGGWSYSADESAPMTAGQRRDFLREIIGQSDPELQVLLGLRHPDNLAHVQEAFGLPGLTVPGVRERRHLGIVIQRLASSEPFPSLDPLTGMPVEEPSEPYDPFVFNPEATIGAIQEWAHSDDGVNLEGTPGYRNVILFGKKAEQVLMGGGAGVPPLGPDGGVPPGQGPPPPGPDGFTTPEDLVAPPPEGTAPVEPGIVEQGGPGALPPVPTGAPPR